MLTPPPEGYPNNRLAEREGRRRLVVELGHVCELHVLKEVQVGELQLTPHLNFPCGASQA